MRILNISLTHEQDDLFIRFDLLTDETKKVGGRDGLTLRDEEKILPVNLFKMLGEQQEYGTAQQLQANILHLYVLFSKGSLDPFLNLKAKCHELPHQYFDHLSTQLVFPKIPHQALGVLGFIALYLNEKELGITRCTYMPLFDLVDQVYEQKLSLDKIYFSENGRSLSRIIDNLLNSNFSEKYQSVINYLTIFNAQYQANKRQSFVNKIINPENYLSVIAPELSVTETHRPTMNDLIHFTQTKSVRGELSEIDFILHCVSYSLRKRLFQPAHLELSYESGLHNYAVLFLILTARFLQNPDSTLSIVDVNQNPFLKIYEKNHSIHYFGRDIKLLMMDLDLNLIPNSNLKEEIIFDPSSSQRLHEAGILINEQYLKHYFSVKNSWAFFTGRDGKDLSPIEQLPNEIKEQCIRNLHANTLTPADYNQAIAEGVSFKMNAQ